MRGGGSYPKSFLILGLALSAQGYGCSGSISSNDPIGSETGGQQPGSAGNAAGAGVAGSGAAGSAGYGAVGGAGNASPPLSVCDGALPAPRAVMLTTRQYANALRDLLGEDAVSTDNAASADEIEIEVVDRAWMTTATLDQRIRLAENAVGTLRGRAAAFFGCSALTDRACVRSALERVGRRAYKRPLEADELDDAMTLYDAGLAAITNDAGESAALLALQGIVSAPSTMYRTEFMSGGAELSPYERAALLGTLLLDSLPDSELLDAAADGSLMTPAGLEAQLDRLLGLPRVREHLTEIVLSAYKAAKIFETPKDEELFPEYTRELQQSMHEETKRFIDDVLWTRSADLRELLTSRRSFVNADLAELYGVPAPRGGQFAEVMLPETRAGLLTQASVLSVLSRTDKTSVVARGLFVRGALLCLPKIPSPPDSVQAQVAAQLDATASQQELADYRATTQPCSSCHSQFDRFGLLMEGFDPIGRERAEQPAPIDFTGLRPFEGTLASPRELAERVAGDGRFVACLARRTLAYALTEAYQPRATCTADPLADAVTSHGGDMRGLIRAIVDLPAFATRSAEEP